MISLRPLVWPDDRASLLALDTSYTTEQIFRLERSESGFELTEVPVSPPVGKSYSLEAEIDAFPGYDWVQIADGGGIVAGVAAMRMESWNRRAVLQHLYVAPESRGIGVGHTLLTAAIAAASGRDARCLWVETQAANYRAIQFYRRSGFSWCGLDTSLYDPRDVDVGEVALFFSRDIG